MLKTEERLLTERMELRLALDRAQLQRTRAVRAKENAEGKCKLLRNQCDSLQVKGRCKMTRVASSAYVTRVREYTRSTCLMCGNRCVAGRVFD